MNGPYLTKDSPPICLHALGQSLVNVVWAEGVIALRRAKELEDAAHDFLQTITIGDLVNKTRFTPAQEAALVKLREVASGRDNHNIESCRDKLENIE